MQFFVLTKAMRDFSLAVEYESTDGVKAYLQTLQRNGTSMEEVTVLAVQKSETMSGNEFLKTAVNYGK